jgi:osmotically-inducible protein OsmY
MSIRSSARIWITVEHDGPRVAQWLRNGVATVHGIVFDDWDLRNVLRVARHIRGVKRVVDDLEIKLGGE